MPATRLVIAAKLAAVNTALNAPTKPLATDTAVRRAKDVISSIPFTKPPIAVAVSVLTALTGKEPTVDDVHRVVSYRISSKDSLEVIVDSMCGDELLTKSRGKISIHPKVASAVSAVVNRTDKT